VGQQTKVGRPGELAGPQIGNGVWIGAHARICGPVSVADGATIAPGARVIKNVPSRALVVGNPARVVFRGYDNTRIL
jgi:serine O-acetyltransferase